MKIAVLNLLLLFTISFVNAQTETSVQINTGLFHYSGNGASASAFINYNGTKSYGNYSYGAENGFAYGFGLQRQHVAKYGLITGIGASFDILRSKVAITALDGVAYPTSGSPYTYSTPVNGWSVTEVQAINFNPYLGYRFKMKKVKLDLLAGLDLPLYLSSYQYNNTTAADGSVFQNKITGSGTLFDPRLRFGLAAWYKKFGITASYAHGLINQAGLRYSDSPIFYEVHSELLRFGVAYRVF